MINVRIKQLPPVTPGGEPRAVTTKVFIRQARTTPEGYCRPLEPGEVVALEDDEAHHVLRQLSYELEMTMDPPTRPLFFANLDQANMTSNFFNPNSAGRAEQAKAAMAQMLADAEKPENQALIEKHNEIERREAAIREREIELGLIEDPNAFENELDRDLADVPASDNTLSPAELEAQQKAAAAELAADAGVDVDQVETPAIERSAVEPEAPTRRRRRRAGVEAA